MSDDETSDFEEFTYRWHVLTRPSQADSEIDNKILKTRIEGPVSSDAWELAVEEAEQAFVSTLAEEMAEHLADFDVETEWPDSNNG